MLRLNPQGWCEKERFLWAKFFVTRDFWGDGFVGWGSFGLIVLAFCACFQLVPNKAHNKAKVALSACVPLGEAIECATPHCWHGYKRHEFITTCYIFFGSHVRRIRLISKNLRVNIIDTVFFAVTCFYRALGFFLHVLPLPASFLAFATFCCIFLVPCGM